MIKQKHIIAKISDIVFSLFSDEPLEMIHLEKSYSDFLCFEEPEVTINAYYKGLPQMPLRDKDKVFDSEMVWSLYYVNGKNVFILKSPVSDPLPYRIAIFDADFKHGEIFSHSTTPQQSLNNLLPNPLEFPLSEVLMVRLLSQGRGLMVHACGIDDSGRGYLLAGNSTHGKTTMARLWKDHAVILNDDRIVLRDKEGVFWMYGTPWHGEYTGVSPQGVPLDKIFFIHHGEANGVNRVNDVRAVSMLIARCFPPMWDEKGMVFTLVFCEQLVNTVPCYELNFVPDKSIVDFVRCVK